MLKGLGLKLVAAITFAFLPLSMLAVEWVQMESKVLPQGWFEYRLKVYENPLIPRTQFTGVYIPATNTLEVSGPVGWTNQVDTWGAGFDTNDGPSLAPYELIFMLRSSETHYRSNRVTTVFGLDLTDNPGIVGYINFPALVPCSAAEADNSPKQLFSEVRVGEIKIDQLLRTNNQVYGVEFSVSGNYTVELQGSHNLKTWDAISRFHTTAPVTTWTTNSYLNPMGRFFRLALVAQSHVPLSKTTIAEETEERARVLSCLPGKETVEVQIETIPGATYSVTLREQQGSGVQRKEIGATGKVTHLSFVRPETTGAVLVEAKRISSE